MSRRRFFILDEPCSASSIPKLLGRVVTDKFLPLQKSAPFPSTTLPHNPEDIIPNILPTPSISTNRKEVLSVANEQGLGLSLGLLFGVNVARSNGDKLELESEEVKQYTLNSPDDIFDMLMENDLYATDVQKLLTTSKRSHGYLVTGFMTTTGTLWTRTKEQSRTKGVAVTLPISQLVPGLPLQLDPGIEPSQTTTAGRETAMHISEEQIFAVSYSLVKVKRRFDKNAPRFTKKTPMVGPPKRANMHQLALGEDEDEESVNVDAEDDAEVDMFLEDIDNEKEDANAEEAGMGLLI